jgi:cadmium resistance protein CadD (predicted permease)
MPSPLGDEHRGWLCCTLVDGFGQTIAAAAVMFAATNIDDAVVVAVLNIASGGTGAPRRWEIWAGQYIGIGLMVVVSLLAALGLSFVPLGWVGLLGLIPLARGIAMLVTNIRTPHVGNGQPPAVATGLVSVVAVTFANGGDNISLYTPAFRIMEPADTAVTIAVFAVGTALWCLAGLLLTSHQRLVDLLARFSRWILPAVFIALGLYILHRTGLIARLG